MGATPRLVHVVLQTANPAAVRDWYCTVLKAHVVHAGHGLTFMTFDDEHHRIALLEVPAEVARPKEPGTVGMHHTAFTFDSLDDLLERYQELSAAGVEPAVPIQHGVTTSLYYRDPDGNFVEMQVDNFATADEATEYMRGPQYDADPVGPAFDVDRMLAARRDGTPQEELMTRTWALSGPELPDPMGVLTGAAPSISA
jgi:catechol-2,3-dioxygenase